MYELAFKVLNMSITAAITALSVIALRLLLRKAPKWISYALWSVVLFRLVCPFSFSSELSLLGRIGVPAAENGVISYIPNNAMHMTMPQADPFTPDDNITANISLLQGENQPDAGLLMASSGIIAFIWLSGVAAMLAYSVISYVLLKRRLSDATLLEGNVFETDAILSPFVCGLIKPRIYLPVGLPEAERRYVLLHERTHIRQLDYLIKPLAFFALSIHWFNPIIWLSFRLMSHDMELSCDEQVVQELDQKGRAEYSAVLMRLATGRPILAGSPLAFGESGTKKRIRSILNYRKPMFWVAVVSIIAVIFASITLLANPVSKFILGEHSISSATTHDFRRDEPYIRELQEVDMEELASRLAMVSGTRRSNQYAGFTPLYSIMVVLDGGMNIKINGYSSAGDMLDISYKGKTYCINDSDFASYVDNICAGKNVASATEMISNPGPSIPENETLYVNSPDGAYRAEAYGANKGITAAGLYPYDGLRIIRNSDETTVWSGNGYYRVEFLWSSNSKYVAIYGEARIYGECFIVAADTGKVISLPNMDTLSAQLDASSQPDVNRPDPYFQAVEWINDTTIRVNYRWTAQEGEKEVSGTYEYDIISGSIVSNTYEISDAPG